MEQRLRRWGWHDSAMLAAAAAERRRGGSGSLAAALAAWQRLAAMAIWQRWWQWGGGNSGGRMAAASAAWQVGRHTMMPSFGEANEYPTILLVRFITELFLISEIKNEL